MGMREVEGRDDLVLLDDEEEGRFVGCGNRNVDDCRCSICLGQFLAEKRCGTLTTRLLEIQWRKHDK